MYCWVQRRYPQLVLNNFKYSKVDCTLVSGEIKWWCINQKYKAFLKTSGINHNIMEKNGSHDHKPIGEDKTISTSTIGCNHRGQTQNAKQQKILSAPDQIKFFAGL